MTYNKKYWKKYKKENSQKIREKNIRYNHSKNGIEKRKAYFQRPEVKAKKREYAIKLRLRNPKKYRAYHNKWQSENKDKVLGYVKKSLERPGAKEKKKKYNKEYYHRTDVKERIKKQREHGKSK